MSQLTSRLKWITFLVVVVILTIIVFQNLTQTEVYILFFTLAMPHAALLTMTLFIGFALGLSASALWKVHAWRVRATHAKKEAAEAATGKARRQV